MSVPVCVDVYSLLFSSFAFRRALTRFDSFHLQGPRSPHQLLLLHVAVLCLPVTHIFLPPSRLNSLLLHLLTQSPPISVSGCCHGNATDVPGNLLAE